MCFLLVVCLATLVLPQVERRKSFTHCTRTKGQRKPKTEAKTETETEAETEAEAEVAAGARVETKAT